MARAVHGGRAMLNLPGFHTTACIVAEVEDSAAWGEGMGRHGDRLSNYNVTSEVTCAITDCDNKVNIEFDVATANQLENSVHKVDTMIEHLTAMREGMIIEHHRTVDRLSKVPMGERYNEQRVLKRSEKFPDPRTARPTRRRTTRA